MPQKQPFLKDEGFPSSITWIRRGVVQQGQAASLEIRNTDRKQGWSKETASASWPFLSFLGVRVVSTALPCLHLGSPNQCCGLCWGRALPAPFSTLLACTRLQQWGGCTSSSPQQKKLPLGHGLFMKSIYRLEEKHWNDPFRNLKQGNANVVVVVRVFVFLLPPLVRALAALPCHGIPDCAPLQDRLQESLGQVPPPDGSICPSLQSQSRIGFLWLYLKVWLLPSSAKWSKKHQAEPAVHIPRGQEALAVLTTLSCRCSGLLIDQTSFLFFICGGAGEGAAASIWNQEGAYEV